VKKRLRGVTKGYSWDENHQNQFKKGFRFLTDIIFISMSPPGSREKHIQKRSDIFG